MLSREGEFKDLKRQMVQPIAIFQQTAAGARRAWNILPSKGAKIGESLSKTIQGPDEPYADFVNRLIQVSGKIFGDPEAGMPFVTQLAFENANTPCQQALCPYQKKNDLDGYIKMCRYWPLLFKRFGHGCCFTGNFLERVSSKGRNE